MRSEQERIRIERTNPNPKMPLVRYIAGTWRVGGILALSRAFGDAYMKGSLQFEGVRAGGDGYSSGFGVTAEPDTSLTTIKRALAQALLCKHAFSGAGRMGGSLLGGSLLSALCFCMHLP